MNKLIDTLRVRSHLWRSCFVKWCGGVFGIWGVVVSFISPDDLGLNNTCLKIMALLVLLFLWQLIVAGVLWGFVFVCRRF